MNDCKAEICPKIQGAVALAVKEVFAKLGVNVDDPESVAEFLDDLRFGRKLRKAAGYGALVFVGLAIAGGWALLQAGIQAKLGVK